MSLFDKDFNLNSQNEDPKEGFDEGYILGIYDAVERILYYVVAKTRKDLAKLYDRLTNDRYMIVGIQLLSIVKDYKDVMRDLLKKQKPDDLEFGDNKDKGVN